MIELDLIRKHCRVDALIPGEGDNPATSEDDALLLTYAKAAQTWVEHYTGRALTARDEVMTYSSFSDCLKSKLRPLQAVVTILYTDTDGDTVPLPASDFRVIGDVVYPAAGKLFPLNLPPNEVVLTATVGPDADSDEEVPADLISAQLLLISHYYNNRDSVEVGTITSTLPMGVKALCDSYRQPEV